MPEIVVNANGPYVIDAENLTLVDGNGKPIELGKGSKAALCRCGGSDNKPFCDGSHKKINFQHDPGAS